MWFCLKLGADRGCAHIRLMKQHNLPVVIQGREITSITRTVHELGHFGGRPS
jgi:hypothetical protein